MYAYFDLKTNVGLVNAIHLAVATVGIITMIKSAFDAITISEGDVERLTQKEIANFGWSFALIIHSLFLHSAVVHHDDWDSLSDFWQKTHYRMLTLHMIAAAIGTLSVIASAITGGKLIATQMKTFTTAVASVDDPIENMFGVAV